MKPSKVIAIPAIALTAGLSLAACGSSKAPAAAPAVTHTVTAPAAAPKPTTPAPTTAAPAPAKTVYVAPAAPAPAAPAAPVTDVPAGMTNCGGGVYAGADTSCPFAQNVAADYTGNGPFSAYSPVTGQSYTMTCTGPGTYEDVVTCEGGNNAEVAFIN
jgi:hypothetical protein